MSKTPSPVFFPVDLIAEIISLLPVKSLVRFMCVSNSWNTLISDSAFVKLHLKRTTTSRNTHFTLLVSNHYKPVDGKFSYHSSCTIIPYPITHLFDNPSAIVVADSHYFLNYDHRPMFGIVDSCNGLICLVHHDFNFTHEEYWFRLWNPSTRKISQNLGYSRHLKLGFIFNFGCDDSTGTFKVVAYRFIRDEYTSEVKVFNVGDNVWRNIESFPIVPLDFPLFPYLMGNSCNCVFLNSTLNWLALHKHIQKDPYDYGYEYDWTCLMKEITVEDLVIVSLDMGTETYNRYLLPQGFDELSSGKPTISVLGECLCFSYFHQGTGIVMWQMKKFGVEESWIQFLKISYHVLQLYYDFSYNHFQLLPMVLSKDGDSLILCSNAMDGVNGGAIIYNCKDNSVQKIRVNVKKTITDDESRNILYLDLAVGYVESLISIC
ncbi:F-box/kelch-repeat protein At3g23880-like [Vicia villosa]|uniref:F-box/kelch-repeat protein At3g23880-like n=1 Tax=Vicia villosa TaxID=3911 RepID=UPI00273AF93D|nr:F-box/kelch-repeat protein At3g23880-like [Vicia villosa]